MMSSTSPGRVAGVRILFSDVDRTLLTHGHVLPERVVEAVRRARTEGLPIVLASARSPAALRPYAERLGATEIAIGFNGAWIGDLVTGATLHHVTLAREDGLAAVQLALNLGLHPLWFADDTVHVAGEDAVASREAAITGEALRSAPSPDDFPGRPGKVMCVRTNLDDGTGFAAMRTALGGRLGVASSHPRLLEISPPGQSKSQAVARVAAHLGLTTEEIAAAGDAENDLAMLRKAGTAVTVANALPEILALAHFVAPSCDEGGMAEAVSWLIHRRRAGVGRTEPTHPSM